MDKLKLSTLADLPTVAESLISAFGSHKVLAFSGPMGAGKTTLIKAICEKLGVKETISSPTFSIVNEYHTADGKKIFHFDFYRIKDINEAYDMGYEEYFYSEAYCFIEWPEMISGLLPNGALKVEITVKDDVRLVSLSHPTT